MMDTKQSRVLARRRKRLIRIGLAVGALALGQLCHYLPPTHQEICHVAAKLVALLSGGS